MGNENIVMLYSGGADSMLMLQLALMAKKTPHCVLIDYEQKHVKELEYAKKQLDQYDISYQVISVRGLNLNSGLTGKQTAGRWENVHSMNVPGRNTIFIGLAISVAENMGIDEVWIGCDMSDYYGEFPDCKQSYIGKVNEVTKISGVKSISLVAPLLGMTKELILQILEKTFNIRLTDMHSGYEEPNQEKCKNIDDCVCWVKSMRNRTEEEKVTSTQEKSCCTETHCCHGEV